MTRMFKQLVESSRKKLSKATTPDPRPVEDSCISEQPRSKKPDFEPLESRVLFSGIGTGFNKKQVRFKDAWGDGVLVKLIGGPADAKFNITLDGGANNHADIENITINKNANGKTVLDIFVRPHALQLSQIKYGGNTITGDPVKTIYAKTVSNEIFTPGFVEIGSIYATTNLRGISMNGADFQNIDVTGNIGTYVKTLPSGTQKAFLGGIADDLGVTQFRSGLLDDPVAKVGFGNIDVSGSVDSLILHGRDVTPAQNNLSGAITIGGSLTSFDAGYSDVLAPITVDGNIGSALFNNVLATVTTVGAIGNFNANNLVASVVANGTFASGQFSGDGIGSLALSGALIGTATASGFGSVSVNGNFTGLLQSTGAGGIGSVIINSGTAFTGTIEAEAGNIGSILISQSTTPFSGQVKADAGNIGTVTAGFFVNAALTATGSIGKITSNATTATVSSGIANSVFSAGALGIGNISSVASITNSQFEAVGGPIGNITVLQGGITGDVFGGSTTTLATSIGNITANLNIEGTSAIASGAIGNITSVAGFIGGSSNTATFNKPGLVITSTSTGTLLGSGVVTIGGGSPGPKSDVFIGGSIGNIYALGDISGNVITATGAAGSTGNIGNITSHEGRIAMDAVTAKNNIGNIYANSQDASFAFDSAGNVLEQSEFVANYGATPVPSASAIDSSVFTAGGTIGTVTANASAVGGYFSLSGLSLVGGGGSSSGKEVAIHNSAIGNSFFTAANGIGAITAADHSAYSNGYTAAISGDTFTVTGTGNAMGTVVLGPVSASGAGGDGIASTTFHAVSGDIGGVTGTSIAASGIAGSYSHPTVIQADNGNVGIVKGVSFGARGTGGDGIVYTNILTGAAGAIAGIYGKGPGYVSGSGTVGAYAYTYAAKLLAVHGGSYTPSGGRYHSGGIVGVHATAGSGGINYIKGYATGNSKYAVSDGIVYSTFQAPGGAIPIVTGASGHGSGIYLSKFYAKSFGTVKGTSTGYSVSSITETSFEDPIYAQVYYGAGINRSEFFATSGIGNIYGTATAIAGQRLMPVNAHFLDSGILSSYFNANTSLDHSGAIGKVYGTTAGRGSGIDSSQFLAGAGIGAIKGTATSIYGVSGITESKFNADETFGGFGAITSIKGTTVGKGGLYSATSTTNGSTAKVALTAGAYGIYDSSFLAGAGIGAIGGYANGAYSSSGIANSTFNADIAHTFSTTIGTVKGYSASKVLLGVPTSANAQFGDGIVGSTFTAGSTINNIYGKTTSPGYAGAASVIAGILDSKFYANAGLSTESSGKGAIDNVTGKAYAAGAYGTHSGISGSLFVAGGGPDSTGTIGTVLGKAVVDGPKALTAFGIGGSTFVAGSASTTAVTSTITSITGDATAEGSSVEAYTVTATGIGGSHFYAGTGSVSTIPSVNNGNGTIGKITGKGYAYASFGTAIGSGISTALVAAGSDGVGRITGGVYGYGKAYGLPAAKAYGIAHSNIQAATSSGGDGYIGKITGVAVAAGQGSAKGKGLAALASGIFESGVWAGYNYGTIGTVYGHGTAIGDSNAIASGIFGVSSGAVKGSYSINFTGGYTLKAGPSQGPASVTKASVIGSVKGVAYAASNTGVAGKGAITTNAYGIDFATISSGYLKGTISSVAGYAKAYSYAGAVNASGITGSLIKAGYGQGGIGVVGPGTGKFAIYGDAIAKSYSNNAYAAGIGKSIIQSGFEYGKILNGSVGAVYGKASADVTGKIAGINFATAFGIGLTAILSGPDASRGAGVNPYTSTIGNVYGYAKAVVASATSPSAGLSLATALGINLSEIEAAASPFIIAVAPDHGIGTIGNVKGVGKAYAYGFDSAAIGSGISAAAIIAADGDFGKGTINYVYGHGVAKASNDTSNLSGAGALASGITLSLIDAGTGYDSKGYIGVAGAPKAVYGKAYALAAAPGDATDLAGSLAYGISLSNIAAGASPTAAAQHSKGTIGNVYGYGYAKAHGGGALAKGTGIAATGITAGTSQPSLPAAGTYYGIIGNVYGKGRSYAKSAYANAKAYGFGLTGVAVTAANGPFGTGEVGKVKGAAKATAKAYGTGNAYGYAKGISGATTIYAGSDTSGTAGASDTAGAGKLAGAYGYGYAYATSNGVATTGKTVAYGIDGLNIQLGVAGVKALTNNSGIAGTGTITGSIKGYSKAYTIVPASGYGFAKATGINALTVQISDAYGATNAVAAAGTLTGGLHAKALAYVNKAPHAPATKAFVYTYGLKAVSIYISDATTKNGTGDTAKAAMATIGGISQIQKSYAYASAPTGYAKAYAKPIAGLKLKAANAYGFFAYANNGYVAEGGKVYGYGVAKAVGYKAKAKAYGLLGIGIYVGNAGATAGGTTYAKASSTGKSVIGEVEGKAYAYASAGKVAGTTKGNRYAYSYAYGIKSATLDAANAYGAKYAKSGYGYIETIYGKAKAYSFAYSAFNALSKAKAYGLVSIAANAGNATTTDATAGDTAPAKPGPKGVIGKGAPHITGEAFAKAYTNKTIPPASASGLSGKAYSYAYGIAASAFRAANTSTEVGYAKGADALGIIYSIIGLGYSHAYAYGKQDPHALAKGFGIKATYAYAADATSVSGIAAAGGSGAAGTFGGFIHGFNGYALGHAIAIGAAQVYAYGLAKGISVIRADAADATSGAAGAYGGKGYVGVGATGDNEGIYGRAVAFAKAYATPSTTATAAAPSNSKALAYGIYGGVTPPPVPPTVKVVGGYGIYAGDGVTTGGAGVATSVTGQIGAITGLANAYAYSKGANSNIGTGGHAGAFYGSKAYGVTALTAEAAYAYTPAGGGNATAGQGKIAASGATYVATWEAPGATAKPLGLFAGEVYGSGIAKDWSIGTGTAATTGTENASSYAFGLGSLKTPPAGAKPYLFLSAGKAYTKGAGNAYANKATAPQGDIATAGIEGKGYAYSYGEITKGSTAPLPSAGVTVVEAGGIKDTFTYSAAAKSLGGAAFGGTGLIGAITGIGKGVTDGFTVVVASPPGPIGGPGPVWGIDPSKFYAGTAYGATGATGGAGSQIGAITGTAHFTAISYTGFTGGAYGMYKVTAKAGSANVGLGDIGTATGGSLSVIGAIDGTAVTSITTDPTHGAAVAKGYGVKASYLFAGSAGAGTSLGDIANAGTGAIANTGSTGITGSAKVYAYGGVSEESYAFGITNIRVNAGGATGYKATAAVGNIAGTGGVNGTGEAYSDHGTTTQDTPSAFAKATGEGISQSGNSYVWAGFGLGTTSALSVAKGAGGSAIGAINGVGKAYSYASTATPAAAFSTADGIRGVTAFNAGAAQGYAASVVNPATASVIGAISGKGDAKSMQGFTATAHAYGVSGVFFHAGVAISVGVPGPNSTAIAGQGTIGTIYGVGYTKATGATGTGGVGHGYSYGIMGSNASAGYAKGTNALGGGTAGTPTASTIGAVEGKGKSIVSGYTAVSKATGINTSLLDAGFATGNVIGLGATVTAGAGYIGKGTTNAIYGYGKAVATSDDPNATQFGSTAKATSYGINNLKANAGLAVALNGAPANIANGGDSYVGNIYGKALAEGFNQSVKALGQYSYAKGITGLHVYAGEAVGPTANAGAVNAVGNIKGFAKAYYNPTITTPATAPGHIVLGKSYAFAQGISGSTVYAGFATSTGGLPTSNATGGATSNTIGNTIGLAYAYSFATKAAGGIGLSKAYGINGVKEKAGEASGLFGDAKAGIGSSLGSVGGYSKARTYGNKATADSRGLTASTFYAGEANANFGGGKAIAENASIGTGTPAVLTPHISITGIYGFAYGYAYSKAGTSDSATTFGQYHTIARTSNSIDGAAVGSAAGQGTIGNIYGRGLSYGFGIGTTADSAQGQGLAGTLIYAGFNSNGGAPITGSQIGTGTGKGIYGLAKASNAKANAPIAGSNTFALGITYWSGQRAYFYTQGSIVGQGSVPGSANAVTGTADAGASPSIFQNNAGINNASFKAVGGSIGNVTGTVDAGFVGSGSYGIHSSDFTAGTSIGNISGTSTGTAAGGIGIGGNNSAAAGQTTYTRVIAGTTIGNILGTTTGTGASSYGIGHLNATAGTSIASITGNTTSTGANAIIISKFWAGTNIGAINSSTGASLASELGVKNSSFVAKGNIGAIDIVGSVVGAAGTYTGFFAGENMGTNASNIAIVGSSANAGATITSLNVTGYFTSADLIVSTTVAAGKNYFGNGADTATSGGVTGAITIGKPAQPNTQTSATNQIYAVEAFGFDTTGPGDIVWGGVTYSMGAPGGPGPGFNIDTGPGVTPPVVRVRTL